MFEDQTGLTVDMQVGIPTDSGVSIDDATRTLNAMLLSENCPDILVVDDLPLTELAEQGALADLAEEKDALLAGSSFFENILDVDGPEAVFALPTRFTLPIVMGNSIYISEDTTVSSLAQLFTSNQELGPTLSPDNFISDVYAASYPEIIINDNLSQEGLKAFLQNLKELLLVAESNFPQDIPELAQYSHLDDSPYCFTSPNASCSTGELFITPEHQIQLSTLSDPTDFGYLHLTQQEVPYTFVSSLLSQSPQKVFVPNTILSICARSKHPQEARDFIAYTLSKESQSQNQLTAGEYEAHSYGGGLPVNKDAFVDFFNDNKKNAGGYGIGFSDGGPEDEATWFTTEPLSDDQIATCIETIESATVPVLFDKVVTNAIAGGFVKYYRDELSLEETVTSISQSVELYLKQ